MDNCTQVDTFILLTRLHELLKCKLYGYGTIKHNTLRCAGFCLYSALRFLRDSTFIPTRTRGNKGWGYMDFLGCFGFNGPLKQYFSPYRAVSQREGERGEKGQKRVKMSKQLPPAPTASAVGPCPTLTQTSRTPRPRKFSQRHRTTRPPPAIWRNGEKDDQHLLQT